MSSAPSACERLAQSRERLRQAIGHGGSTQSETNSWRSEHAETDGAEHPKTSNGASLLLTVFEIWWAKQPLRVTLALVAQATETVLQPTAQRHPYRLVLGAAAVGGLCVLVRPWRWVSSQTLLVGLLPQLMSQAMKRIPALTRQAAAETAQRNSREP